MAISIAGKPKIHTYIRYRPSRQNGDVEMEIGLLVLHGY